MGQVVLRNDCSGIDEQLEEGRNGWLLDSADIGQFADTLETVLNRETTSNAQLAAMGRRSQEMVERFEHLSYYDRLVRDHRLTTSFLVRSTTVTVAHRTKNGFMG